MAGLFNKVKNAVIGENNDYHDTPNTAAPRGEPTIGTTETTPGRGLASGPQGASGFHSDPRARDESGAYNARGINNNPIGGLAHGGSRTTDTEGPHNSNIANKLDPRVDSDRDGRAGGLSSGGAGYGSQHQPGATSGYGNTSTNVGPHSSNIANKLDPRVDSDRDGRSGVESGNKNHGGLLSSTTRQHGSTNAGPHDSNVANKLDPRVDSDRDGRGIHDNTHGSTTAGGFGSSVTHSSTTGGPLHSTRGTSAYDSEANNGPHDSRVANKLDPRVDSDRDGVPSQGIYNPHGTTAGAALGIGSHNVNNHHNTSTTAGPHNSNVANKLDPRVDSDRDGRNAMGGNTVGGFGTHTSSNAGPHDSNIANKLDPRVDSDRDGRGAHGTHQAMPGSYSANSNIPALNAGTHNTSAGGFGTNTTTAGPHNSNIANKLDPTVDSDLDGRGRHGTHGTSATALGAGAGGLGVGHSSHGIHGTHGTHGHHSNVDSGRGGNYSTEYPQKYDPLVTSIPGTHNKPPGAPLTAPPHTTETSGLGDHHNTHGTHGTTSNLNTHDNTTSGVHNNHGTSHGVAGTHSGSGAHDSNLPGPAPKTAGPHKSDLLNKLDPKVDSNMDGKAGFMS